MEAVALDGPSLQVTLQGTSAESVSIFRIVPYQWSIFDALINNSTRSTYSLSSKYFLNLSDGGGRYGGYK